MLRKIILLIISLIPLNLLRIYLYRLIFKYDITYKSKVGYMTLLHCDECVIFNATIGSFNYIDVKSFAMKDKSRMRILNRFSRLYKVTLSSESFIGFKNSFIGTRWGLTPYKEFEVMYLGEKSLILKDNLFDFSDTIFIGDNVVFAGSDHQVWTHGFTPDRIKIQASINIDNNVYIGSRSMIMPGVKICTNVLIASGTVVSKSITEEGFYTSSSLIKKSEIPKIDKNKIINFNKAKFFRKTQYKV